MPLLADPGRLASMGEAAQKLGRLDAADALCDLLVQAVEGTTRTGA